MYCPGPIPIHRLPWWLRGKESACQCRRHGFDPWVGKIAWTTPSSILAWEIPWSEEPGELHGAAKESSRLNKNNNRHKHWHILKQAASKYISVFLLHSGCYLRTVCAARTSSIPLLSHSACDFPAALVSNILTYTTNH